MCICLNRKTTTTTKKQQQTNNYIYKLFQYIIMLTLSLNEIKVTANIRRGIKGYKSMSKDYYDYYVIKIKHSYCIRINNK